jgi:nucleoid DNA-binding protein
MNKQQLIARVGEKLGGTSKADAARAVEAVFESIAEGLNEDGIVRIGKWGTYKAEEIERDAQPPRKMPDF